VRWGPNYGLRKVEEKKAEISGNMIKHNIKQCPSKLAYVSMVEKLEEK